MSRVAATFDVRCSRLAAVVTLLSALLLSALAGCETRPTAYTLTYEVEAPAAGTSAIGDIDSLVTAINDRLRDTGRARAISDRELVVDVYGPIGDRQLELVKQRIDSPGELGFRLVAAANEPGDVATLKLALDLPPDENQLLRDGRLVAQWLPFDERELGSSIGTDGRAVTRTVGDHLEILVLHGPNDVTDADLFWVRRDTDSRGSPTFNFAFNEPGSVRMHKLCSDHLPNPKTGEMRYLAVVFDGKLISAPAIVAPIAQQGQISGQELTPAQIDTTIAILEKGPLGAKLRRIREERVTPPR